MDKSQPTIFVSIASYCDPTLPRTLDDCLANASYPENLRFGICWQFDENQPVELQRFKSDARFRFSEHPIKESQGGSWARDISQQLWDGEEFVIQVDSHMMFAKGWDSNLVRMMRSFPSDKPLISMIAPLFKLDDQGLVYKQYGQGIRSTKVNHWEEGLGWSPWFVPAEPQSNVPSRNRFLSGCFVFSLGKWTEEVRQDPDHYYWGEEFALSLRSFTHGYDIFLPDEIVVWHMLHPNDPPRRHWENGKQVIAKKNKVAFDRLRCLAYSDSSNDQLKLGRYGLGRQRSRAEYERFTGMDLAGKRAHPDVYSGRCPDPVTIKSESDWTKCMTLGEYSATLV